MPKIIYYFAYGSTTLINASIIAQTQNPNEDNHLIVECPRSNPNDGVFTPFSPAYYNLMTVATRLFAWKSVQFVDVLPGYWSARKNPIQYFKQLRALRNSYSQLIGNPDQADQFYLSSNTFLWKVANFSKKFVTLFEHGAAEYNIRKRPSSLTSKVLGRICSWSGFNYSPRLDRLVLCDGSQATVHRIEIKDRRIPEVISIDARVSIREIFERYLASYEQKFPLAWQELQALKQRLLLNPETTLLLYLPTLEVTDLEYPEYLRFQLELIHNRLNDLLILVKPHPADERDFAALFAKYPVKLRTFTSTENNHLPAEVIAYYFENVVIAGNFSTSLLYCKWFLEKEALLLCDPKHRVFSILKSEYEYLFEDFLALKPKSDLTAI